MEIAERAGVFLVILAIANACGAAIFRSRAAVAAVTIGVGVAALIPLGVLSINDYAYSLLGPLGGGSLLILAVALADSAFPELRLGEALGLPVLACILIVVGIPFYAAVLGSGDFDVYRLGFGGWQLPLALAGVLAVGLLARAASVALWVALSGTLYLAGVFSSRNLFDYLIDPVAVILAGLVLADVAIRRLRRVQ
jgi:hypothetical protein